MFLVFLICVPDQSSRLNTRTTTRRAWRLPGRWSDGGRRSTVTRWTRRHAAQAYAPIPDLRKKFSARASRVFYIARAIADELGASFCAHLFLQSRTRRQTKAVLVESFTSYVIPITPAGSHAHNGAHNLTNVRSYDLFLCRFCNPLCSHLFMNATHDDGSNNTRKQALEYS